MWNEPYLETCCRSALHRLLLCESAGRPDHTEADLKDARCLDRLTELGQEKRCMSCGEYWPSDLEFFEVMRSSRDGLTPRCIACIKDKLWQMVRHRPEHEFHGARAIPA